MFEVFPLSIREGQVWLDDRVLGEGVTILLPPAEGERGIRVEAIGPARLLRVVHGPGHGFVRRSQVPASR